jgi:PD-(D/E)XK endonuclease
MLLSPGGSSQTLLQCRSISQPFGWDASPSFWAEKGEPIVENSGETIVEQACPEPAGQECPTHTEQTHTNKPRRRHPPTNVHQSLPPKRRGEVAEAAFLHKAASLGFSISKPWGESDRYDFILDCGGYCWRVQGQVRTHRPEKRIHLPCLRQPPGSGLYLQGD